MRDWDGLKVVLNVHRSGGLAGAARALRLSEPTVSRQLAKAEAALGSKLFDRSSGRLVTTEAGMLVVKDAEDIERRLHRMQDAVRSIDQSMSGTLSVSVPQNLLTYAFATDLTLFQARHPEIDFQINASDAVTDFDTGAVDVVIRAEASPKPHLWGQHLTDMHLGFFVNREAREDILGNSCASKARRDVPLVVIESARHSLETELRSYFPDGVVAARCNNLETGVAMTRAGAGVGCLPWFVGRSITDLDPLRGLQCKIVRPLWALSHKDFKSVIRIRRFVDFIKAQADAAPSDFWRPEDL